MYDEKFGELIADDEIFGRLILDGEVTNYIVSSYGRVWSDNVNRFLSIGTDNRSGRRRVELYVNGVDKTIYIARLIALTFLGPGDGLDADHIDNDYTNDVLSNIQWLTPQENKSKAHKSGSVTYVSKPGDESNFHVYNEEDIHEVCKLMEQGWDMKSISKETGVSLAVIQSIKSGKNWTIVSSKYNISNTTASKSERLPKEINDFIKQKIIEGYTNKQVEKLVFEEYNETGVYASITNHRRRLKKKGLV